MERKLTCTNCVILLEKKRFAREHTKNPNANVRARQVVTFLAAGYHPSRVPAIFLHILCKIWEHTYVQKGLVGTWGDDALIFFISYMYNAKSDHSSPKIKPYIHGNRK